MKRMPTAQDVLSDIEFELLQGAVSRDELGQGIQTARQYQNKLRGEVLASLREKGGVREALGRLFQFNDMLLTLLQETAAAIQALRLDLQRVARMSQTTGPTATPAATTSSEQSDDRPFTFEIPTPTGWEEDSYGQPWTDIEQAMRPEALQVEMIVRSTSIPVIGGLMRRLRIALHNLVLFYVGRLAGQQTAINQTYGDTILRLVHLCQQQQEQLDWLNSQVAALQSELSRRAN